MRSVTHYSIRIDNSSATRAAASKVIISVLCELGADRFTLDGTVLEPPLSPIAHAAYVKAFGSSPNWLATRRGPSTEGPLESQIEKDLIELAPYVQSIQIFEGTTLRGGIFDAATVASGELCSEDWFLLSERLTRLVQKGLVAVEVEAEP